MAEHTWTEGKGLKNGLPDINWAMRKFITVYPALPVEGEEVKWKVTICWGDTWGHIAYGNDTDYRLAMLEACEKAIKEGCPAEWLPYKEE
tara:strand:+ start:336 stop:605 length:270 start_codon:yes stop_codon:yes gene_type:complete